jgi:hypothetical protein
MNLKQVNIIDKPLSKTDISDIVDHISDLVNNGVYNSIHVAIIMNSIEYLTKSVKEKIQNDVINELYKYPKNKAEIHGATVSTMDSVKYDYSNLPGWQELEDQIVVLREKQKEIEEHEKKYHRGDLPIKSATSTFKVQLAK